MIQNDLLDDLTIVIPTYNRNYYLSRILEYLKINSIKNIIIADSSSPEKHEINKKCIKKLFKNNVQYIWHQENEFALNYYKKILFALKKVDTPYVTLCADKDFPIIPGIRKCMEYLDKNPDYNVADGSFYSFSPNYLKKELMWIRKYRNKISIDSNNPISRIETLLNNCTPIFYSLHRTNVLCRNIHEVTKYAPDARFGEYLVDTLSVSSGKYAHLNVDYWCRESGYPLSSNFRLPTFLDYWNEGSFDAKIKQLKDGLYANFPNNSIEDIDAVIDPLLERALDKGYSNSLRQKVRNVKTNFLKLPMKYLSEEQKMKFINCCPRLSYMLYQDNTVRGNSLSPELMKIDQYIKSTMDNNAYINDLPLCHDDMP